MAAEIVFVKSVDELDCQLQGEGLVFNQRTTTPEERGYYVPYECENRRALLVLRSGLTLADLAGQWVDILIGARHGFRNPFLHDRDQGTDHIYITVLAIVPAPPNPVGARTLKEVILSAPIAAEPPTARPARFPASRRPHGEEHA